MEDGVRDMVVDGTGLANHSTDLAESGERVSLGTNLSIDNATSNSIATGKERENN